ncbi:hypothetical protein [Polyangium mundeleinium]|uniref:Transmembrane protein n=1 Tax=Polyangium mundeleinium TaxID=2995306 RepID=A0ABT5EXB3_9BACT|nr:hypothetical protein [Polyangium mundeleinium]MDC0746443.1 hypothetical protein [Polyangium mundeleinium]
MHAHVERARAAAYEEASRENNGDKARDADNVAARDHATFAAIEAAGPARAPATTVCFRCGTAVPTARMTYGLNGQLMCVACSATYDDRAERRKIEGSTAAGFLLGFFLSVFGLMIVKFVRKKPAEQDGVWIGLIAGSIVIYIPLFFFLTAKLALK